MNWLRLLIIFISVFIVQTVFMPYLRLFGVAPDLLLVLVAIYAIIFGRKYGVISGAIAGFLQDAFSSTVYVHTISKITVGYIIGFIKENLLGGEEAVSTVAVFIVSVLAAIIDMSFLYFFIGKSAPSISYVLLTVTIYSFYNIASVPVLYPIAKNVVLEK